MDDNDSDASGVELDDITGNLDQYCDLLDMVEATELSDAYHSTDGDVSAAFGLDSLIHTLPRSSPSKRSRHHVHYS